MQTNIQQITQNTVSTNPVQFAFSYDIPEHSNSDSDEENENEDEIDVNAIHSHYSGLK